MIVTNKIASTTPIAAATLTLPIKKMHFLLYMQLSSFTSFVN